MILPESDSSIEELESDKNWRIVYGAPVLICHVIPMIIISVFFRHPSLRELLGTLKEKEQSEILDYYLKRIFHIESEDQLVQARDQIRFEQKIGANDTDQKES